MKKIVAIFQIAVLTAGLSATDVVIEALGSNQAFDENGETKAELPSFGAAIRISDKIQENLEGSISYESDPAYGNTLSARASLRTSYMEVSAGPSFGVMNQGSTEGAVGVLFQPGLGIGFSVTVPGIVVARADTDFALPAPGDTGGKVYLQRSSATAGFYLPNVLCSAGIHQRINTESGNRISGTTDYGFYAEAFRKGSSFRIGMDFIYRVMDYYVAPDHVDNRKLGNLVIGGGLTWAPKADFSVFAKGSGALYTFSLGDPVDGLEQFLFDFRGGVRFQIGN